MNKFIAAMDNSGGSAGGVLDLYGQDWTEENKMQRIHEFRLRMMGSPKFNSDNIWGAILYKDSVDRGAVPVLEEMGIYSILKIDSGCNPNGTLKQFPVKQMIHCALINDCVGTKMRSVVHSADDLAEIVEQQFTLAKTISDYGLLPIVEPEVPIDHADKANVEEMLADSMRQHLAEFEGNCILKLTPPDVPNLYHEFTKVDNVKKVVFLSGGYDTNRACNMLGLNDDVSASFSRALSEGLQYSMSDDEFNSVIDSNIERIVAESTPF